MDVITIGQLLLQGFYATIGTLGFSLLAKLKGRRIILASLGGGIGWFVYLLITQTMHSYTVGIFFATVCVAIYCELLAFLIQTSATPYLICSIIPLVPGSSMYYAMAAYLQNRVDESIQLSFKSILIAGDIAIALALVSAISYVIRKTKAKMNSIQESL